MGMLPSNVSGLYGRRVPAASVAEDGSTVDVEG